MLNDIKFNRGRGGLGRALAGKDHISGIIIGMALAKIPAAVVAAPNAVIYSVQDADDLDIVYSTAASNLEVDALRYAIETVYQQNKKAVIHLNVFDNTGTTPPTLASKLIDLQNGASGEIRQALILAPATPFTVASLAPLQAACDTLEAEHKPISVIYAPDFTGLDIASFDLRALDNKNVSVAAGMDGNGKGNALATAYLKTFSCAGAVLGVLSKAKVNENIAWVGAFNVNKNDVNEFDVLKLASGEPFSGVSKSELDAINTKGFIFLLKHVGKAGSYFNDAHTASIVSGDFAYIENVRTVDKAVRESRIFLLDKLNAPLYVNDNGTLTEDSIAEFKNEGEKALEEMQKNGEISTFSVTIDPDQNILTSSKIAITISIVPAGVARNIVVNIGLAVRVANV